MRRRPPGKTADPAARFAKHVWKPGTLLYPIPAVLVTSAGPAGKPNILTVAWTGIVCSEPPMLSISIRKATYSHGLISRAKEFVVNVPSVRELNAVDYCGVVSGRNVDKFTTAGLTPAPATTVSAPLIAECPVNLECQVRRVVELGSHVMFVAEITAVQVTADLVTPSGRLALEQAGLTAFAHGRYYALGKELGRFGYSVRKSRRKGRRPAP